MMELRVFKLKGVLSPPESVFLLETDQPKGLLVFGVFTSTR